MRHDFDAIPDDAGRRDRAGSMLTRIYHDIGLAAVAQSLGLMADDFDADLMRSLARGVYYLIPTGSSGAPIDLAA